MEKSYTILNIVEVVVVGIYIILAIWSFRIGQSNVAILQLIIGMWVWISGLNRRNAWEWREIAHKYRELLESTQQK